MLFAKNLALKIPEAELKVLSRSRKIGVYAYGKADGVNKLRFMAFTAIPGLEEAFQKRDFKQMKEILLTYAGSESNFLRIFGKTPIEKERTPYFKGSYMTALGVSFPECSWTDFDFKKLPKNKYNDSRSQKRLLEEAKEIYHVSNNEQSERMLMQNNKALTILRQKSKGNYNLNIAQEKARKRFPFPLDGLTLRAKAKLILQYVNNDKTFRAVLGGTLLFRDYYPEEIKKNPKFSINWWKAIIFLYPEIFKGLDDIQLAARAARVDIYISPRKSFRG